MAKTAGEETSRTKLFELLIENPGEVGVRARTAAFHHLCVKLFDGIFNALTVLPLGVDRGEESARNAGVAAHVRLFFQEENRGAFLRGGHRRGKARRAAADHYHVVLVFIRSKEHRRAGGRKHGAARKQNAPAGPTRTRDGVFSVVAIHGRLPARSSAVASSSLSEDGKAGSSGASIMPRISVSSAAFRTSSLRKALAR